jgi:hypothetical protein
MLLKSLRDVHVKALLFPAAVAKQFLFACLIPHLADTALAIALGGVSLAYTHPQLSIDWIYHITNISSPSDFKRIAA